MEEDHSPEAAVESEDVEKKEEQRPIVNISARLREMARDIPHQRAVVFPEGWDNYGRVAYTHLTFQQLDHESDCIAHGLNQIGITRGIRTVLMVPPGLEFFALVFALFKVGAVPVIVDPGMGIDRMVRCLKESRPDAFIGIPRAHLLRKVRPSYFKTVNKWVTMGRKWFWGGYTLRELYVTPWAKFPIAETFADETAAILFTTGSTGPAKGAIYTHGIFDAQVRHIRSLFHIRPGEIDLPTFPLFALFDPALGMTAIIPDMDPTLPAEVDPVRILEAVTNQGVTNMFASPALLNKVGRYGLEKKIKLPTLKRVVSAGAPVSTDIIETFAALMTETGEQEPEIHTPYGATEAMPVTSIESREIVLETKKFTDQGFGACVGYPLEGLDVRIIRISDDVIEQWSDELEVEDGDIGEITVKGDIVTKGYFELPEKTALAKIPENKDIWHRMGDLGWKDNRGRIWFCGRKNQRVITEDQTLFTIPCEAIFNRHPAVFRSALVGTGKPPRQRPVICIEPEKNASHPDKEQLKKELFELAAQNELTKHIRIILFHDAFPVDVRHNAKIFREELADWAEAAISKTTDKRDGTFK